MKQIYADPDLTNTKTGSITHPHSLLHVCTTRYVVSTIQSTVHLIGSLLYPEIFIKLTSRGAEIIQMMHY